MTLAEFDAIRQYLPDDTEVILKTVTPPITGPKPDEDWAIELCNFGNHDGRFNVVCHACGNISKDYHRAAWKEMTAAYIHKPCPMCGKLFYKKGQRK